jgi:formate dehydrogenase subunit gamma
MNKRQMKFVAWVGLAAWVLLVAYAGAVGLMGSPTLEHPAVAQSQGNVPGSALGNRSDSSGWRQIRRGVQGTVSIPDKQAGVLVQSEGESWRSFRNGPLSVYGGWSLAGIIVLLAVFFLLRGRIKIDAGFSGRVIERFKGLERFTHWLTAFSFIILGLTGLNVMYGKYVLMPIIGKSAFSTITTWGKVAHNYVAFAFMIGIVMMLVIWARHNIASRDDLNWIAKGGGMFTKGVHPPADKFNFGQKALFWLVIFGGIVISVTGINLMVPFTFTDMQGMQLTQLIHAVASLVLIVVIIAHIYIGTLGMEGAYTAMSSGYVDENWAKEHHSLWAAREGEESAHGQPAE